MERNKESYLKKREDKGKSSKSAGDQAKVRLRRINRTVDVKLRCHAIYHMASLMDLRV